MSTPIDFRRHLERDALLIADSERWDSVAALDLLSPAAFSRILDEAKNGVGDGRARNALVPLPQRNERLHLRPLRHGGWLAGLWGGRILAMRRPVAELETTAQLRACGAPVPQPVLVIGHRRFGFWQAALATIHIEESVDGLAFLASAPDGRRLLAAARAAGRSVREIHDAGCLHPDLHIKNLLICKCLSDFEVVVIDFDGAHILQSLTAGQRMAGLMRLYRFLVKHGIEASVGKRGCVAFFAAYLGGDRELRAEMLARLPREQARIRMHALAYRETELPWTGRESKSRSKLSET